jgi:hypothetical protein
MTTRFLSALLIFFALSAPLAASAVVHVNGYYRKDGTYVAPHYRSDPDSSPYNNWSYPGNTNPYTGKVAPGNPDTYLKNYYDGSTGSLPVTGSPAAKAVAAAVPPATLARDQQIAQLQALVQVLLQMIAELHRQRALASPATTTPH